MPAAVVPTWSPPVPNVEWIDGGMEVRRTQNEASAEARFKVPWTSAATLANWLLGITTDATQAQPIQQFPSLDFPFMFCRAVSVKPFLGDRAPSGAVDAFGLPSYTHALVEASFGTMPFEQVNDTTLREERIDFAGEYLTIPSKNLSFSSGGPPLPDDVFVAKMMPTLDIVVRFPNVLTLPIGGIVAALGTVNAFSVAAFGTTFAPETLLFLPPTASRRITFPGGVQRWDVEYRLSGKLPTWNHFFDPTDGTFKNLFRGGAIWRPHSASNWAGTGI